MAGLRERKKQATRIAIRDAAMALFATQGFTGTTIEQIADAANVSRATVFTYYAAKEDIVFGDAASAVEALVGVLAERDGSVLAALQPWLGQLTGWIEPELVLQLRLAREFPVVGARRLQNYAAVEQVIAEALETELQSGQQLSARLAAASLITAFRVAEETAAARMEQEDRALTSAEIETLFGDAVRFAEAGIAALRG